MNHTLGARWLGVAKRALVESQKRVTLQIGAFIAKHTRPIVSIVAMNLNHRGDGLLFAFEPREKSGRHNISHILSNY
jgi:hypothetical protein